MIDDEREHVDDVRRDVDARRSGAQSADESEMPNRNEPMSTQSGRPRASIAMTMAMKPSPWVMKA